MASVSIWITCLPSSFSLLFPSLPTKEEFRLKQPPTPGWIQLQVHSSKNSSLPLLHRIITISLRSVGASLQAFKVTQVPSLPSVPAHNRQQCTETRNYQGWKRSVISCSMWLAVDPAPTRTRGHAELFIYQLQIGMKTRKTENQTTTRTSLCFKY